MKLVPQRTDCSVTSAASLIGACTALFFSTCATGQCDGAFGQFTTDSAQSGRPTGITPWDADGPGPQPSQPVVFGAFTKIEGTSANRIAMLSPAGWMPFGPGFTGIVNSVCVYRDRLVAAGEFTHSGAAPANYIAYWDGSQWNPLGGGANAPIAHLAVYNDTLVATGAFTTIGGVPAVVAAVWNGVNWSPMGGGLTGLVRESLVFEGELILAGSIQATGVPGSNRIVAWNGSAFHGLGGGVTGNGPGGSSPSVDALAIYQDHLYAGGIFQTIGGVSSNYLSWWDGSSWHSIAPSTSALIRDLVVHDGSLVVAGEFTSAAGLSGTNGLARWDGLAWSAMGNGVGGIVLSLSASGSSLVAGGLFNSSSGRRIARWDGSQWRPFQTGMNELVSGVSHFETQVLAFGPFRSSGGTIAPGLCVGSQAQWRTVGSGVAGSVSCLLVHGSDLIAGGTLASAGGTPVSNVARWDGSAWHPMGALMNASAAALADFNGDVVVGGIFTQADGASVNRVAIWDGSAWRPLGSGFANGEVRALTQWNGSLVAAGTFTTSGTTTVNRIARWNGTSWEPFGSGLNSTVNNLAVYDGDLYAGGFFSVQSPQGQNAGGIARWNGKAWESLGSGLTGTYTGAQSILAHGGDLLVVGLFSHAGGVPVSGDARWDGSSWHALPNLPFSPGLLFARGPRVYVCPFVYYTDPNGRLQTAGRVYRLTEESWIIEGGEWDKYIRTAVDYQGELVFGGDFFAASGAITLGFARWLPGQSPETEPPVQQGVACPRGTINLLTTVSAWPTPTIQWRRNSVPLSNGPTQHGSVVAGATTSTLSVSNVSADDNGQYDCVVSNTCGEVVSQATLVSVCIADVSCDGFMDGIDYDTFNNAVETDDPLADINADGFVDGIDYDLFNNFFEAGC